MSNTPPPGWQAPPSNQYYGAPQYQSPPQSPKTPPWKRLNRVQQILVGCGGCFALFVLLGLIGAAFSGGSNLATTHRRKPVAVVKPSARPSPARQTPKPPTAPTPTPTPLAVVIANYKQRCESLSVSQIANDPAVYQGSDVTFQGTIVKFVQDSSGNATGIDVSDPNNPLSIIYVELVLADPTQLNDGDTVTVWGKDTGVISGTNAFGATVTNASVEEMYLTDSTDGYVDAQAPYPQ